MFPIKVFETRFREILNALDAASDGSEAVEELNAEFEDALFMLSQADVDGEDWREELDETLEEFEALAGDYRRLPDCADAADRLELLARMARENLKNA